MFKKALFPVAAFSCLSLLFQAQVTAAEGGQVSAPKETAVAVQAEQAAESSPKEICEKLQKKLIGRLGVKVTEVNPTPIPGLYEAVVEGDVIYSDAEANHVIMGQLFDTRTQQNLTAETKERLSRIDFSTLPLNDAIKTVHGTGERELVVFSDPNCGFCKKMEASLKDLKDVTIYTFLYPVITPGSKDASANIWCSKDASKAWSDQMVSGKKAAERSKDCDISALDRNIELGKKLGVSGTPTVFVPSGRRAPGAVDLGYIEQLLAQAPNRKALQTK